MKKVLFVFISLLLLSCSKSKYVSGDCLITLDGYYWYIANSAGSKYSAMGWQGNSWGNPVEMEHNVLDVHSKVECPIAK